jgi:hypothetical protein
MRTLAAAAAAFALLAAPAAAEEPCPLTWSAPASESTLFGQPEPDPDVGPFSGAPQRLKAVRFDVDGDQLVVGVDVQDMRRATRPGWRWAYWLVAFRVGSEAANVQVFYDALLDELVAFGDAPNTPGYVAGTVAAKLGPGGGWTARVPLAPMRLKRGDRLTNVAVQAGDFLSYTYMNADPASPRTWPSGVYSERWEMAGPPSVPLIGCPGVQLTARDLGNARGARLSGDALPAGTAVALEVADGDGWRRLGTVPSGRTGGFSLDAALPPGPHRVRAVTAGGESVSAVTVTD